MKNSKTEILNLIKPSNSEEQKGDSSMENMIRESLKNLLDTIEKHGLKDLKKGDSFKLFFLDSYGLSLKFVTYKIVAAVGDVVELDSSDFSEELKLNGAYFVVEGFKTTREGEESDLLYRIKSVSTGIRMEVLGDYISVVDEKTKKRVVDFINVLNSPEKEEN